MNIIAGERRGTQLFAPAGLDTRPTQAKVRESLFNMIAAEVPGAVVLDLFAGSGALAFEALSRGAEYAVLCDRDRAATAVIRRNTEKLRYEGKTLLIQKDWKIALSSLNEIRFSLVFLDPPYRMEITQDCTAFLAERHLLADNALILAEHRAGLVPPMPPCFRETRLKSYGDTEVHFYRYHQEEYL